MDVFWIDDRINWTLWHRALLHFEVTVTHIHTHLLSTVTSLPLLGSGFQRPKYPFLWVPKCPRPQLFTATSLQLLKCSSHHYLIKVKVTLRPTVSRPVLVQAPISDPRPIFPILSLIILSTISGLLMWDALSDEKSGPYFSVFCRASPAQPFSDLSHS
jgi:hypothetical protein